jgi:hypothetical protein
MTPVYLDTEFNGFNGALISIALVSSTGDEFYEVLECLDPVPWVAEHVIPFLEKDPISLDELQTKLQQFLFSVGEMTIVADWPDDISYFCKLLITDPGECLNHPNISFILDQSLSSRDSEVPHNALHDARAIADDHLSRQV